MEKGIFDDLKGAGDVELRLREQEAWYRLLIESATDLISTHALDSTCFWASPASRRLLGYEPEEMVGRPVFELIHPEDLGRAREAHGSFLASEEPQTVTARYRRSDGGYLWMEATIRRISGGPAQVMAVTRDISERKRAEEEQTLLRRALERAAFEWRSTFDSIATPILLLGLDGRVRRLNRAARDLIGRDYGQIIGRTVAELGRGQPVDAIAALVASVLDRCSSQICEARCAATSKVWEIEGGVPTLAEAEAKVIVQVRDISATVELQESLRRSETMAALGSVVGGVAHEVRNPLFGMSAVLDAFESRFGERREYRRYLTLLRTELGRMTALMQALLEYGKPPRFELAPGDLVEAVEGGLAVCRATAERQAAELVIDLDTRGHLVMLDHQRLVEAVKNVIENALQHSPQGGQVRIEVTTTVVDGSPWLRLAVEDDGPGFSLADLPKVFEPFFSRRQGGTGLGLSIVSRVVEGHGGKVRVRNAPRGGALVELLFPALRQHQEDR